LLLHFLDLSFKPGLQVWIEFQALVEIFLRLGLSAQPQLRQAAISKGSVVLRVEFDRPAEVNDSAI